MKKYVVTLTDAERGDYLTGSEKVGVSVDS